MSDPLRLMPQRQPLIEEGTSYITREWYRFFQDLYDRVGGSQGQGSNDFSQNMPEDSGLEELKSELNSKFDGLAQSLATLQFGINQNDVAPVQELVGLVNTVMDELSSQRELLTELTKAVEGLQQGYQL